MRYAPLEHLAVTPLSPPRIMHRGGTASDFSRAANGDDTVLTAIEVNKA